MKKIVSTICKVRRSLFLILCISIGITVYIFFQCPKKQYDSVGTINGEPISAKLFYTTLIAQRSHVYSYFHNRYGVDDSDNFWTTNYGGEVPIEIARKNALREITAIMAQQIYAKNAGLVKDISYDSFLIDLKNENARRKDAVRQNKVIYGPVEYSEDNYYNYLFDNLVIKLKSKLEDTELAVSDNELKELYEAQKETSFKIESVKVCKISVPFETGDENTLTARTKAKTTISNIENRLLHGDTFERLSREYSRNNRTEYQVFNEDSKREDSRKYSGLRNSAFSMHVGEVSNVIETSNSFIIIKCINHSTAGYRKFEDVKNGLSLFLIDKKYKEFVERIIREAVVVIDKKAIESIKCN